MFFILYRKSFLLEIIVPADFTPEQVVILINPIDTSFYFIK